MRSLQQMADKRLSESDYLNLVNVVVRSAIQAVNMDFHKSEKSRLQRAVEMLVQFEQDNGIKE